MFYQTAKIRQLKKRTIFRIVTNQSFFICLLFSLFIFIVYETQKIVQRLISHHKQITNKSQTNRKQIVNKFKKYQIINR
jgi:hypothetical protein